MARSPVFQKMNMNYSVPEALGLALKEIQELRDFIAYYEVGAIIMKPYFMNVHREEIESLSGYYNTDNSEIDFENLLTGQKEPGNDAEQLTINISGALKPGVSAKEDFS